MSDDKISGDAVPTRFAAWLLAMGCPAEKVPSKDKLAEICRGQYYMVWRSLMERVEAKDIVTNKRLQVFCDDVQQVQQTDSNRFTRQNKSTVVPEQLLLWRQQAELKEKVAEAKTRVTLVHQDLNQVMNKISMKMTQRNESRRRVEDVQRRAWLLREVAQELHAKRDNLLETRAIADSLCCVDEGADIQDKLDKCVATLRRPAPMQPPPVASSSVMSSNGDTEFEEQLTSLVKCRGDALCTRLYERRSNLVPALTAALTTTPPRTSRVSPQSVLSHSAALHCTLALEASKCRVHLRQARKRLVAAISELNNYLTGESCELLVILCEKAHVEARVKALRTLLDELTAGSGIFQVAGEAEDSVGTARPIAAVDKAIESKRDELKKVIASLAITERKIQNVRECLAAVFNGFHKDAALVDLDRYKALNLDLPQEAMTTLREFYEQRRERRRSNVELSMELDVSDGSLGDAIDTNNPRFIDELRIYLKRFTLEKNRKLILESGEKIWLFETLSSSIFTMQSKWISEDITSPLMSPSDSLATSLGRLTQALDTRAELEASLRGLQGSVNVKEIDISSQTEQESQTTDKTKKRLNESIVTLQKTQKALDSVRETMSLWVENRAKAYMSPNRTVDGMGYADYEAYYLMENCISCK